MSQEVEKSEAYVSWLESGPQKKEKGELASSLLWATAVGSFAIYASWNMALAIYRGAPGAELLGTIIGSALWPLGIMALSFPWNKTQRGRVKVFTIVTTGLIALAVVTCFSVAGYTTYRLRKCPPNGDCTKVQHNLELRYQGKRLNT